MSSDVCARVSVSLLATVSILLAACQPTVNSQAGIEGTGISSNSTPSSSSATPEMWNRGPIEATDGITITVNSLAWSAADAVVSIDTAQATVSDLRDGMMATVKGMRTDPALPFHATIIDASTVVRGPIFSIDVATHNLNVMGQTVELTSSTVLDVAGQTLDSLYAGQVVSISGFVSAHGVIVATRIAAPLPNLPYTLSGSITDVDATARTFTINGLTVRYGDARLSDLPQNGVEVGLAVTVVGGELPEPAVLKADQVTLEKLRLPASEDAQAVVTGPITKFQDDAHFEVGGQPIARPPETSVPGIVLYSIVQVTGTIDAEGAIVASSIVLVGDPPYYMLVGPIDAIDPVARTIALLGQEIVVDEWTAVTDGKLFASGGRAINLAELGVGDSAQVYMWPNHHASTVTRVTPLFAAQIGGYFTPTFSAPTTFGVAGPGDFDVRVTSTTLYFLGHQGYGRPVQYRGCSCNPSSEDAFWALVENDLRRTFSTVEVNGHFEGPTLIAEEVYFLEL